MDNVIYAAVYFAVTLGAFLIGKYVCPNIPVAPLVGAWIEISQNNYVVEAVKGRSSRGSVD